MIILYDDDLIDAHIVCELSEQRQEALCSMETDNLTFPHLTGKHVVLLQPPEPSRGTENISFPNTSSLQVFNKAFNM